MRIVRFLCCFLPMWAALLPAQRIMEPKTSSTFMVPTTVSSLSLCTYGNTSCWYNATTATFTDIKASSNQYIIATDASGCSWLYSDPLLNSPNPGTWQPLSLANGSCGHKNTEYANNGKFYALISSCGTSGGHYATPSGTTWQTLSTNCYDSFDIDRSSGNAVAVADNGALWESTNYGVSWFTNPGCSGNSGASSAVMLRSTAIAVTCKDASIWYGKFNANTYNRLQGSSQHISGRGGIMWVIGTDSGLYRFDLAHTGTAFTRFAGNNAKAITYGDGSNVWSLSTAGTSWRYMEWTMSYGHVYTATTICQGTCPSKNSVPPVHHTAVSHFVFKVKGAVAASSNTVSVPNANPSDQLYLQTGLTVRPDSQIVCFINSADCNTEVDNETYSCSEEGTLNNGDGGSSSATFKTEMAYTRDGVTGDPFCGPDITQTDRFCQYPVAENCANTLTPDFNPNLIVTKHDDEGAVQFDTSSWLISINGGPWISPLSGNQGEADQIYYVYIGSKICTNNPT